MHSPNTVYCIDCLALRLNFEAGYVIHQRRERCTSALSSNCGFNKERHVKKNIMEMKSGKNHVESV